MRKWLQTAVRENRSFLLFVVLMIVFRSTIADWNEVPTGSMNPTIVEGDRILVNKMAYDIRVPLTHISIIKIADPKRGDIVIFDSEVSDKRLVKRVIGVPGDTVQLQNNVLHLNGRQLSYHDVGNTRSKFVRREGLQDSDYTVQVGKHGSSMSSFPPVKVPIDHYLVLGDNRDNSADSRVIGFVPRNEIVGRARAVVLSLDYDNYYIPRSDRFFQAL